MNDSDADVNGKLQFSYFKKPDKCLLGQFFEYQPQQPFFEIPFKTSKAFYRKDKSQRFWLSYDIHSQSLFCSVCLSFSSEDNVFTRGLSHWTHIYQRINEHEKSKNHTMSTEAYLHFANNKSIDYLLFSEQKHKLKEEVKNNRRIQERVILLKYKHNTTIQITPEEEETFHNMLFKYKAVFDERPGRIIQFESNIRITPGEPIYQ